MARPESISDIDIEKVEFGSLDISKISTDGVLLEAYGAFLKAVQKAGNVFLEPTTYTGTRFYRQPTLSEKQEQLTTAQGRWDASKKQYEIKRDIGQCEYSHLESAAKLWAEKEQLPWPPAHEEIKPLDAVIRDIDEMVD